MLDRSPAFDGFDGCPSPVRAADPAAACTSDQQVLDPVRGRSDPVLWRSFPLSSGSFADAASFAAGRPQLQTVRVAFPETPELVRCAGQREAVLSPLVVLRYAAATAADARATRPWPARGQWISLPHGTDCGHAGTDSPVCAALLPRAQFVAQRLLFRRMWVAPAQVDGREVQQLLDAIMRRAVFGDLEAFDIASAELVLPIADLPSTTARPDFVERVRRSAGISRRSVFRAFRQRVGMPAHQLGMELRVRRAFDLVCAQSLSAAAIVAQLGYASQSHLCSNFKAAFGISPGRLQDMLDDPTRLRALQATIAAGRPRPASAACAAVQPSAVRWACIGE